LLIIGPLGGHRVKTRIGALARKGFEANSISGFAFAAGCIVVASAMRWLLGMWFGATLYFVAFFPAVILSALFAGFWPGMFALALSVAIGVAVFVPANLMVGLPSSFIANLVIYLVAGLATVWLGHLFRSAVRELQLEQAQRELILKEVEHRARNMGALGAAIVEFSLKDNKEAAALINSRMRALQATNDLITRAPKMEPDIESIVRQELAPYDLARCDLRGGHLPLRSDIARAAGLVIHELTTNAVKYGALSSGTGRIEIGWARYADGIEIKWKESGGPKIEIPTRTGFGTKLIDTTAKGLNGSAEREFGESGLSCRVTFQL
jgi:two-component sensor histidine kinase